MDLPPKVLKNLKICAGMFLLAGAVWALTAVKMDQLRAWVEHWGVLAPLAYLLLWIFLPCLFFPVPLLVLPGGLLFGLWWGTILTVAGALINTVLMYYLGRWLLYRWVQNLMHRKAPEGIKQRFNTSDQRSLSAAFLVLRLVPLVSYNLINYMAPLTRIRLRLYILTTVVGILPGAVVFINAGDKMLNPEAPAFLWAVCFLVVLTLASLWLMKRYFKKT